MANTDITLAQLKIELGAVKTAVRAKDWDTAYQEAVCAAATLTGLESQIGDAGVTARYREQIEQLLNVIEKGRAKIDSSTAEYSRFGNLVSEHG